MLGRIFSGAIGVTKGVVFSNFIFEQIQDYLALALDYVISMDRLIPSMGLG